MLAVESHCLLIDIFFPFIRILALEGMKELTTTGNTVNFTNIDENTKCNIIGSYYWDPLKVKLHILHM